MPIAGGAAISRALRAVIRASNALVIYIVVVGGTSAIFGNFAGFFGFEPDLLSSAWGLAHSLFDGVVTQLALLALVIGVAAHTLRIRAVDAAIRYRIVVSAVLAGSWSFAGVAGLYPDLALLCAGVYALHRRSCAF